MLNETTFSQLLSDAITKPGMISSAYSAFYGYSIGNRLLAWAQCMSRDIPVGPIATFMGWKDKGRFVKKGAKAIMLCMPVAGKRKATEEGEEDSTYTRFVFRNNWFVLAQTEGDDVTLPALPEWDAALALTTLDISLIEFTLMDGNCQGFARERSVSVSPLAALPHKTLFHELAHVVLGHTAEGLLSDDDRTPRSMREVEAESVALVCCEALGLPGAEFSRGYIQSWNQAAEPISERSAQRIFKAADQILKAGHPKEAKES